MIETQRLYIIPLPYDQLIQYINNDPLLDAELGIQPVQRHFSEALSESLEHWIVPKMSDPRSNMLYLTLWTIILKKERIAIGDICFKNEPDEKGEIEIGYGTYEAYRKNGYMTEAVGGMLAWAGTQPGIKAVTAEVRSDNMASLTVLNKNRFVVRKEKYGMMQLRFAYPKRRWWLPRKAASIT